MHPELAAAWREARDPAEVVHLDSAACSRTSRAVQQAMAEHLSLEARVGGYVAEATVAPRLAQARATIGALTGFAADEVSWAHSAADAMAQLLVALRPRSVALLPSDYQRTVGTLEHLGCERVWLPEAGGRLDLEELPDWLDVERPEVVVLCAVAAHSGIAQPVTEATAICRELGVPVVVDAAQALGQIDLAHLSADALVGTSRKWLAGPRGVGFLAVTSWTIPPAPPWIRPEEGPSLSLRETREPPEASIAGRVGLAVALEELVSYGPTKVLDQLHAVARQTREVLAGTAWTVLEQPDEPSAITTLRPPEGVDVAELRMRLITDHGILTTCVGPERALAAPGLPVLRVSPHVDGTLEELERLAAHL